MEDPNRGFAGLRPPRWGLPDDQSARLANPLALSVVSKKHRCACPCKLQVRSGMARWACRLTDRRPEGRRRHDPLWPICLVRTPSRSEIVQDTTRQGCLIDAESRRTGLGASGRRHISTSLSRASIPDY